MIFCAESSVRPFLYTSRSSMSLSQIQAISWRSRSALTSLPGSCQRLSDSADMADDACGGGMGQHRSRA